MMTEMFRGPVILSTASVFTSEQRENQNKIKPESEFSSIINLFEYFKSKIYSSFPKYFLRFFYTYSLLATGFNQKLHLESCECNARSISGDSTIGPVETGKPHSHLEQLNCTILCFGILLIKY